MNDETDNILAVSREDVVKAALFYVLGKDYSPGTQCQSKMSSLL
jgi:hypothetical protein